MRLELGIFSSLIDYEKCQVGKIYIGYFTELMSRLLYISL